MQHHSKREITMKKNLLIALLLSLVVTGCQTISQPTKTPLELQSIQAKEFETSKKSLLHQHYQYSKTWVISLNLQVLKRV